jgi:hypothetical protein
MVVLDTSAYYNTATITVVKSCIVQSTDYTTKLFTGVLNTAEIKASPFVDVSYFCHPSLIFASEALAYDTKHNIHKCDNQHNITVSVVIITDCRGGQV